MMLALMNVAPGDRHFHDCVPYSLEVLRMATLHPSARASTVGVVLGEPSHAPALTVLMEIAHKAAGAQDSESVLDALHIVCNLVSPPPALAAAEAATAGGGQRTVVGNQQPNTPGRRDAKRAAPGVATERRLTDRASVSTSPPPPTIIPTADWRQLSARLRPARGSSARLGHSLVDVDVKGRALPTPHNDATRALCRAPFSLAQDPAIAQTLQTLRARRLTKSCAIITGAVRWRRGRRRGRRPRRQPPPRVDVTEREEPPLEVRRELRGVSGAPPRMRRRRGRRHRRHRPRRSRLVLNFIAPLLSSSR